MAADEWAVFSHDKNSSLPVDRAARSVFHCREMVADAVQKDPFGLRGSLLDGRFRIDREVAEGGFGVVYFATQIALDRPVAIKVLKTPSGFDEAAKAQFRDRFASEAKTIARIHHPHIVDVYDFGISTMPSGEVAPWMALEWLEGETLENQLAGRRGRGGQSPTEVFTLFRPILQAFAYAHKQGIVHRDIKPPNIMAVPGENAMVMRVLDFGIAKLVSPDEAAGTGHTKTGGMPAFSPLYAAPEQIAFGRTGPWTDVHALGLILTELLTDQPPYLATNMQLFEEIIAPTRPTPKLRGIDVGGWEPVLRKAVALSPGERWRSASELLTALEGSLGASDGVVIPEGGWTPSTPSAPNRIIDGQAATELPGQPSSQSQDALAISGTRSASRRGRGWMIAGSAVVLLAVLIGVFASRTPRGKSPVIEASSNPVGLPPAASPPAVRVPVREQIPAPRPIAPPPSAATTPASGGPDTSLKTHPKPARHAAAPQHKSKEIDIE
jgi:serine/threonine protein kinase